MSAVTLSNARLLTQDFLVQGVIEDIITQDAFFDLLPFVAFSGEAYRYQRELGEAEGDFTGINGIIKEGQATFQKILVDLTELSAQTKVPGRIQAQLSDHNDQTATQISAMAKKLARRYMRELVNGIPLADKDASGGQVGFAGLRFMLDTEVANPNNIDALNGDPTLPSQTVALVEDTGARAGRAGRELELSDLDILEARVVAGDGRPQFLMAHSSDIIKIKELLRAAGGTTPTAIMQREFGAPQEQLMFNGIPVYRNDYVDTAEMVNFYPVHASGYKAISAADAASITLAGADLAAVVADIAASYVPVLEMGRLVSISGVSYFVADGRFTVTAADDVTKICLVSGKMYKDQVRGQVRSAATPVGVKDGVNSREGLALAVTDFYCRIAERDDGSRIYAGILGEGVGVCGLTTEKDSGVQVIDVGYDQEVNAKIFRLCWYCSSLLFNRLALACIKNII